MISRSRKKDYVLRFPSRKTSTDQDDVLTSEKRTLMTSSSQLPSGTKRLFKIWLKQIIVTLQLWGSS